MAVGVVSGICRGLGEFQKLNFSKKFNFSALPWSLNLGFELGSRRLQEIWGLNLGAPRADRGIMPHHPSSVEISFITEANQ